VPRYYFHSSTPDARFRDRVGCDDLSVTRPHARACAAQHAGWMSLSRVIASLLFVGLTASGCTTRTLMLHHVHTSEKLNVTYKKDGQYDNAALNKINWIMRDWRMNKATTMDPQLVDLLWEVYHDVGATQPIQIIGGYRTPSTNEMLRTRSRRSGVALYSLHMLGKAIDFYIPGVSLEKIRETAMRLQGGGVGYYPTSGSPFVHLDVGNVSAWLARADIEHGPHHWAVAEPKRSLRAEIEAVPRGASARPAPSAPAVVVTAGYYRGYGDGGCYTYVPYGWTWHRTSRC
jgi:uncharacterized protein YcbK (DUF882 family)